MALFVIGWSLANMFRVGARPPSLGFPVFALGLGGAGVAGRFEGGLRMVPATYERAFVIGAYTTGATLGAPAAPMR
jgi:hypothetical protein